jgi:hypothetical protein
MRITIELNEAQIQTMVNLGTFDAVMTLIAAATADGPKTPTAAPKAEKQKADKPKAEETKTAPSVTETAAPETENDTEETETVDFDTVKSVVADKAAAGKKAELRKIFEKHGGTKLSDVPEANLAAVYAEVTAL